MNMNHTKFISILFGLVIIFCSPLQSKADQEGFLLGNYPSSIRDNESGKFLYLPGVPDSKTVKVSHENAVAIVDSGFASDHPQLKGFIVKEVDFTSEGVYDELGHGTVVALNFLKGSNMKEAASLGLPTPGIINVKVANKKGKINKRALINAISWIKNNKIRIANLSLGFEGTQAQHADLCDAVKQAEDVLFIVAAGNSGPGVVNYPAACKVGNVMAVGAAEKGKVADYSGRGDIYAPGSVQLYKKSYLLYLEGNELAKKGDINQALEKYTQANKIEPLPEAYFQRGVIFLQGKKYLDAQREFKKAIQLNPDFPEALEHFGLSFYLTGEIDKAIKYLKRAALKAPDNPRIQANYQRVLNVKMDKSNQ